MFNFVSSLSLLLWLLVVASWVRSYWVADEVLRRTLPRAGSGGLVAEQGATHVRGRWGVVVGRYGPTPPDAVVQWKLRRPSPGLISPASDTLMRRLGFGFASYVGPSSLRGWMVWAPHWPFAMLFGVAPAARWRARRRRLLTEHRRTHGLCLGCGYNLTGNTSGNCPECGLNVIDNSRRIPC